MKQRHKKSGRRGRAPQIMYTDRPDNPWRDRYLICEDCERLANYEEKPPRPSCNNSTVLELDMTAPFSRDNCMVTSCEIVQMIKEDVWVLKDEDGKLAPSPHKREPAFPVQVPCVFFFFFCGMFIHNLVGHEACFFLILEDFKGCHLKKWCPENEHPHLKNDPSLRGFRRCAA